jgi:hypothetical protein
VETDGDVKTGLDEMRTGGSEPLALGEAAWPGDRLRSFRVRLMRCDRPQSRMLLVRARNENGARARAREEAGRDWRVASVHLA